MLRRCEPGEGRTRCGHSPSGTSPPACSGKRHSFLPRSQPLATIGLINGSYRFAFSETFEWNHIVRWVWILPLNKSEIFLVCPCLGKKSPRGWTTVHVLVHQLMEFVFFLFGA